MLQEEERERRMDYIPDESAINVENIEVSSVPPDCHQDWQARSTFATVLPREGRISVFS